MAQPFGFQANFSERGRPADSETFIKRYREFIRNICRFTAHHARDVHKDMYTWTHVFVHIQDHFRWYNASLIDYLLWTSRVRTSIFINFQKNSNWMLTIWKKLTQHQELLEFIMSRKNISGTKEESTNYNISRPQTMPREKIVRFTQEVLTYVN